MAGLYPDAPARKVPYDVDGSVAFRTAASKSGAITLATAAQLQALNNESNDAWAAGVANGTNSMGVVFPYLTDIAGIRSAFPAVGGSWANEWETSVDTTNGVDGTWVSRSTSTSFGVVDGSTGVSQPHYRTVVIAGGGLPWAGIKGVRITHQFGGDSSWYGCHLYGAVPAAVSPDRLTLWHPTLDQELGGAGLDFGDVIRGTVYDRTFRVKNLSPTLTANSILLSMTALTDAAPTYVGQYTISQGGAFAATQTIPSIAAGAVSPVCTLRLTMAAGAALSVWRQRLTAAVTTWS